MAALVFQVPAETARVLRELDVPGSPELADSHVTVIHFGKDVPVDVIGDMLPVVHEVTCRTVPFSLATNRISTFPAGDDGVPVIALVESRELHDFHHDLCGALDDAGVEYDTKFKQYRPHVTVAYAEDPATEFELQFPEVLWSSHELVLWGSDRGSGRLVVKFPLSLPNARVASRGGLARAMVQLAVWRERDQFV